MGEERKPEWKTLSGLEIPHSFPGQVDFPGKPPYTGGIHDTMYRSRLWTMRQYAGFSSAKETNERFKLLLDRLGDIELAKPLPEPVHRFSLFFMPMHDFHIRFKKR